MNDSTRARGTLLRKLFVWAWRVSIVVLAFFNLRLYVPSPLVERTDLAPPQLAAQLASNRAAIDAGCPPRMQKLFPEGYYFCYAFHGLTWVELALRDHSFSSQAIEETKRCLSKLNSPQGKAPFPAHLPPDHGMFYCAWKCLLRAGLVLVQKGNDAEQTNMLREECDAIKQAIEDSETPFLASYDRAAWPCDTIPAIHAMATYEHVTGEGRYTGLIEAWLREAKDRLDQNTDLLPHTAGLPDGRKVGVARATSQVIMLRHLPDIDPAFARDQYERFRDHFFTSFVGIPCVREYPHGIGGAGDVDSGPLIFGRSISGTVMTMGIASIYGDHSYAHATARAGETVGLPWTTNGRKKYVGGIMPTGEIIVAYAHVARPWFAESEHHPERMYARPWYWRWQVHSCSLLMLLPALPNLRSRRKTTAEQPQ